MNLDRLLKLLKLANHNPNDSEANSAARAASKMLGEENYKWLEDAKKNGGRPRSKSDESTIRENYDPRTDETIIRISRVSQIDNPKIAQLLKQLQAEIQRPRTWNDVNRSEEAWWRSNYEGGRRGGKSDQNKDESWGEGTGFSWEDEFWKRYQKTKEEARSYDYETRGGFYRPGWDIPYNKEPKKKKQEPVNWSWTQQEENGNLRYKKVYKQRNRNCTKCGMTQLTSDDTTPFVCYSCKIKG